MSMSEDVDRSCRFCGCVSRGNTNIFKAENADILSEARAVYPIVLYKHDPLPKYSCRKCITQIRTRYSDLQRIVSLNHRWTNLVRKHEPDEEYIHVINSIERAKRLVQENIKLEVPGILEHCLDRFYKSEKTKARYFDDSQDDEPLSRLSTPMSSATNDTQSNTLSTSRLSFAAADDTSNEATTSFATAKRLSDRPTTCHTDTRSKSYPEAENLADIPSMFAKEGCSLITFNHGNLTIKKTKTMSKCNYCKLEFESLELLAIHQTTHMRLSTHKAFTRKCLPFSKRRGRMTTVADKKVLRCLSCYKVFELNSEIREHWETNNCDFYCLLCEAEYPDSPKSLRDHVKEVHGISYASVKQNYERFKSPHQNELLPSKSATIYKCPKCSRVFPTMLERNEHKRTAPNCTMKVTSPNAESSCPTCGKTYQNIKARNSHMRSHKPSFAFGELIVPPNGTKDDNYNEMEDGNNMDDYTQMKGEAANNIVIKDEPFEEAPPKPVVAFDASKTMPIIRRPTTTVIRGLRNDFDDLPTATAATPLSATSKSSIITPPKTIGGNKTPPPRKTGGIKVKALDELLSSPAIRSLALNNTEHNTNMPVFKLEPPLHFYD